MCPPASNPGVSMSGPVRLLSRRNLALAIIVILALVSSVYSLLSWRNTVGLMPRQLNVSDEWTYKVLFPDAKSYQFSEKVTNITEYNGTKAYVFFRDDPQHISTQYMWVTVDWREARVFKPHIGNTLTNATETYNPPLQIFRAPLRVGEQWNIESTLYTMYEFGDTKLTSSQLILQSRRTDAVEELSVPAGTFSSFKVAVLDRNKVPLETLWFDPDLGQVVYAEYYNGPEKVSQTLVSYALVAQPGTVAETRSFSFDVGPFETVAYELESRSKLYLQQTSQILITE
jgi:hypothetical protein